MRASRPGAAGAVLSLLATMSLTRAAMYEPSGNQVLLGVWTDPSVQSPLQFNQEVGGNMSAYQVAQQIPLPAYNWVTGAGGPAPAYQVLQTQTNAYIALTVYPASFNLQASDYTQLGQQILNYTANYQRQVFLRFAPEMQGLWFPYGFQPYSYLPMWRTMYTSIKAIVPDVAIVWAPNTGQSYPYGQNVNAQPNAQQNLQLLDTNGDGQVTAADDAFSPFYPGDDYVDWIGLSVYYKGPNNQNINEPQQADFCGMALNNVNPNTGVQAGPSNFYQTYCAGKLSKACMFAESGAAYHTNQTGGEASQVAIQTAWINGCTMNTTMYGVFPRLKMWMMFEHAKTEYDGGVADFRDYRVAYDPAVRSVFESALATATTQFAFAIPTTLPAGVATSGRPSDLPGGQGNSTAAVGIVFQTARAFDLGAPSLFGNVSLVTAGAQRALQAATISVTVGLATGVAAMISRRAGRGPI